MVGRGNFPASIQEKETHRLRRAESPLHHTGQSIVVCMSILPEGLLAGPYCRKYCSMHASVSTIEDYVYVRIEDTASNV
eukprot:scaffold189072_cov23-Tisochrysis_lutea.AAC.1